MTKTSENPFEQAVKRKISSLLLVAINSALIMGCSMLSTEPEVVLKGELEQRLERYTKLEPEIQRILALESDMQLIISELSNYSTLGTDPLGNTVTATTMQNAGNQDLDLKDTSIDGTNSQKVVNTSGCTNSSNTQLGHCSIKIGLHIAAFSDKESVLPGWLYLKNQLPIVLTKGKSPLSIEVKQDNIAYQSLRLGPFNSVYQAKKVCDEARHLVSCAVVKYYGRKVGG